MNKTKHWMPWIVLLASSAIVPLAHAQESSAMMVASLAQGNKEHGKAIFDHYCAPCHAPGLENPGTMNLSLRINPEEGPLEHRKSLPADYIKYIVRHGLRLMPPFRPTEVSDADLEDLTAYLAK